MAVFDLDSYPNLHGMERELDDDLIIQVENFLTSREGAREGDDAALL